MRVLLRQQFCYVSGTAGLIDLATRTLVTMFCGCSELAAWTNPFTGPNTVAKVLQLQFLGLRVAVIVTDQYGDKALPL